jgi:hypothetical protein
MLYVQAIMVTFLPNEKLSMLMTRLHRLRRSDPTHFSISATSKRKRSKHWGGADQPKLEEVDMEELDKEAREDGDHIDVHIPFEKLTEKLPTLAESESIEARDPLSCVYAFNALCKIALSTIFGVRVCKDCPECRCANAFGSVEKSADGVFGRVEALLRK